MQERSLECVFIAACALFASLVALPIASGRRTAAFRLHPGNVIVRTRPGACQLHDVRACAEVARNGSCRASAARPIACPRVLGRGYALSVNDDGTCEVDLCPPTAMCPGGPTLVECPGAPVVPLPHGTPPIHPRRAEVDPYAAF